MDQWCASACVSKVTANAVEILDSVEEWPMEVIQEQSST